MKIVEFLGYLIVLNYLLSKLQTKLINIQVEISDTHYPKYTLYGYRERGKLVDKGEITYRNLVHVLEK